MSLGSVVCSQAEVSVTGSSLVQRSPTERYLYVITKPRQSGGLGPLGLPRHTKKIPEEVHEIIRI